jgi:hypothetical protein
MAMGATVSRIRIELIFRRCWNLVTPSPALQGASPDVGRISGRGLVGASGWHLDSPQAGPAPATFLESRRGIPIGSQCAFGCEPDGDPAAWVVGGMLAIDCCRASSLAVRAAIWSNSRFVSAR